MTPTLQQCIASARLAVERLSGTPFEATAREYLRILVEREKAGEG